MLNSGTSTGRLERRSRGTGTRDRPWHDRAPGTRSEQHRALQEHPYKAPPVTSWTLTSYEAQRNQQLAQPFPLHRLRRTSVCRGLNPSLDRLKPQPVLHGLTVLRCGPGSGLRARTEPTLRQGRRDGTMSPWGSVTSRPPNSRASHSASAAHDFGVIADQPPD